MGDQRRLAECLTSLGIKEIFNCICPNGLCKKAIDRARRYLDEADEIQTRLQVSKGNSRAQCLAKLGRCLVRSGEKERGKTMIEDAIRIRDAAVKTPDHDDEEEGGENVCCVMLGATCNDKAGESNISCTALCDLRFGCTRKKYAENVILLTNFGNTGPSMKEMLYEVR